jgi:hypothetical protein
VLYPSLSQVTHNNWNYHTSFPLIGSQNMGSFSEGIGL